MLLSVCCSQSRCGRLVSCCSLYPPPSGDKALPGFLSSCLQEGMAAGTTLCIGWWLGCHHCFTASSSWNWRNWKPSLNSPLIPDRSQEQIFLTQNPSPKNTQTTHGEWEQIVTLWGYLLSWLVRPQAHFRSLTIKKQKLNACLSSPQILVWQPGIFVPLKMETVLLIFFLLF